MSLGQLIVALGVFASLQKSTHEATGLGEPGETPGEEAYVEPAGPTAPPGAPLPHEIVHPSLGEPVGPPPPPEPVPAEVLQAPAFVDPSVEALALTATTAQSLDRVLLPKPTRPPEGHKDVTAAPALFASRAKSASAGAATVLLTATIRDRRHGVLQPVYAEGGALDGWRIRAVSAARLFGVCGDDILIARYSLPSAGFCTGVLVAPDLVLTAGHCVDEVARITDMRVVFGYTSGPTGVQPVLKPSQVVEVELETRGDTDDWALLRLREPRPSSSVPAPCRPADSCTGRNGVFAVTHPLGMAQQFLPAAQVTGTTPGRVLTDLDAYIGSSGSPVFERDTGRLLGVIVSGRIDFRRTRRGCMRSALVHREPGARTGEKVLPLSQFPADIRTRMTGKQIVQLPDEIPDTEEKKTKIRRKASK